MTLVRKGEGLAHYQPERVKPSDRGGSPHGAPGQLAPKLA